MLLCIKKKFNISKRSELHLNAFFIVENCPLQSFLGLLISTTLFSQLPAKQSPEKKRPPHYPHSLFVSSRFKEQGYVE